MMAASTDFRPEQVPNANYTRVPDFRQCPLLALKNDRVPEPQKRNSKLQPSCVCGCFATGQLQLRLWASLLQLG